MFFILIVIFVFTAYILLEGIESPSIYEIGIMLMNLSGISSIITMLIIAVKYIFNKLATIL